MAIFCFDIDGTVTPHRSMIDSIMFSLLENMINKGHKIWFITGGEAAQAKFQLGEIFNICDRVYCCSGSELWVHGELKKSIDYKFPKTLITLIYVLLQKYPKNEFNKKHISFRTGLLSISVPGHSATREERAEFIEWDTKTKFRERCVSFITSKFPELKATLGGQTSIDITPASGGKVAVLNELPANEQIFFWCDEAKPLGNDYEFAEGLTNLGGIVMPVRNWQETYHQVKEIIDV